MSPRKHAARAGEAETPKVADQISAERHQFAEAIVEVYRKLAKIEALCENPHWNVERRWKIAGIAREAMKLLEEPSTTENSK